MAEDYAMQLNRDAQVNVLDAALPLLGPGLARRLRDEPPGALHPHHARRCPSTRPSRCSKRAGEDALRALIPALDARRASTSSSSPAT